MQGEVLEASFEQAQVSMPFPDQSVIDFAFAFVYNLQYSIVNRSTKGVLICRPQNN